MQAVTLRELNRWTLARQHLLERTSLGPVEAIEHLGGMQAQYSPSPYIGLWSRLDGFDRATLEAAVLEDRVLRATLMRGTLHLVSAREFPIYRSATVSGFRIYADMVRRLVEQGVEVDSVRTSILERLREGSLSRVELRRLAASLVPPDLVEWAGYSIVAVSGALISEREDGLFGRFGSTGYRLGPVERLEPKDAWRHVARAYLAAFGPATRGDLAQWSGENVSLFSEALAELETVSFRSEDGRTLIDLQTAPRPDPSAPAPVRFLPKWDNVLLGYERRERVLPEPYRKTVIRKNGDVLPTFLVDGFVAGAWEAPLRGKAQLTLTPFGALSAAERMAVEAEGEAFLAWLRPDAGKRDLRWA